MQKPVREQFHCFADCIAAGLPALPRCAPEDDGGRVRPGRPNGAASSFFRCIVREPLAGVEAAAPGQADGAATRAVAVQRGGRADRRLPRPGARALAAAWRRSTCRSAERSASQHARSPAEQWCGGSEGQRASATERITCSRRRQSGLPALAARTGAWGLAGGQSPPDRTSSGSGIGRPPPGGPIAAQTLSRPGAMKPGSTWMLGRRRRSLGGAQGIGCMPVPPNRTLRSGAAARAVGHRRRCWRRRSELPGRARAARRHRGAPSLSQRRGGRWLSPPPRGGGRRRAHRHPFLSTTPASPAAQRRDLGAGNSACGAAC